MHRMICQWAEFNSERPIKSFVIVICVWSGSSLNQGCCKGVDRNKFYKYVDRLENYGVKEKDSICHILILKITKKLGGRLTLDLGNLSCL